MPYPPHPRFCLLIFASIRYGPQELFGPVRQFQKIPNYNFWDYEEGIFEFGPYSDSIFPYYGANFWKNVEIPLQLSGLENGFYLARINTESGISIKKFAVSH